MLVLRKIAITGGLACGKTSVCRILEQLGAYVVSADEIVHQLLSPHTPIGKQVIDLMGADIVVEGAIDRSALAKRVFNQPKLLKSLEEVLHPAVRAEIERQYEKAKKDGSFKLFVAEIPLLFESNTPFTFDAVIAVIADPKQCQERFTKKTGYDKAEWERRMQQQLSQEEKAKKANFVVNNSKSLQETEEQVQKIFKQLTGD